MAKGDKTLKCTISFSSTDVLPSALSMSKTMTLTVPGTTAGDVAQLQSYSVPQAAAGSGTFVPPNLVANDLVGRVFYYVQNTGSTYDLIVRHLDDFTAAGSGLTPEQLGVLKPGEFALYSFDDGTMDSDATRDHLRLELSCATSAQTTTASVFYWLMDA
jgi:hypothetical protein